MRSFKKMAMRQTSRAFTAMEVMMVIALLVLMLALIIPRFFDFEGSFLKRPAVEQVQRAFAEAHRLAQVENRIIFLAYDEEQETILLSSETGNTLDSIALPKGSISRMRFYRLIPENEMSSEPAFEVQEYPLDRIPFAPYGTSPIEVEIESDRNATRLVFDPFTPLTWVIQSE